MPEETELVHTRMTLVVYGRPAPQGSKTPTGRGRGMRESSRYVKPWRKAVVDACKALYQTIPGLELDAAGLPAGAPLLGYGPVAIELMVFSFERAGKPGPFLDRYPAKAPDSSKLLRATEDALTTARAWKDDARVVDTNGLRKRYCEDPHDPFSLDKPGVYLVVAQA